MKRSAWMLSLLGLVGLTVPTFAQESKTQTSDQQGTSPPKSTMKKDTKSETDPGAAKSSDSSLGTETKQTSGTAPSDPKHPASSKDEKQTK